MENRLVTVLGGGGFVGRYVVQELLRRGARVRIAQRNPKAAWYLRPQGKLGHTQFIAADVGWRQSVERAVAGSDAVVNLVGTLSGNFGRIHVEGARNVAEAAAMGGVGQLVHVSAIGADPESRSAYGRTKGEGERAVREAFPHATILRPSIVFGLEDRFTNRFAEMIRLEPFVPVVRGSVRFQPVYVVDVADAVAAALGDPRAHGGRTYELAGPDALSMAELLQRLARWIDRDPHFVTVPDAVAAAMARFGGWLPGAPITWDQWLMLQRDNVVSAGAEGFAALGITPTPMAAVAPNYLVRYRRNGRFAAIDRSAVIERSGQDPAEVERTVDIDRAA